MNNTLTNVTGVILRGFRIASGLSDSSPFPRGTLEMQAPVFKKGGLDLGHYYPGTLNVDLKPRQFSIVQPDYIFENVLWAEGFPPESFSFINCSVGYRKIWYRGLIYYPHPETKIGHYQPPSVLEIMAPKIDSIDYGDSVILRFKKNAVSIIENTESPFSSRSLPTQPENRNRDRE